jgi:nucleoside-specific outer membrane channel protein Tsx
MTTLIRNLILAVVALASIEVAAAADPKNAAANDVAPSYFSDTELMFQWGDRFDLQSNFPDETSTMTVSLEHYSTWKYGDNFFFTDAAFDLNGNGGSDARTVIYTEYYPTFSLSKITGNSFSAGPIRDVSVAFGINVDGDGFLALLYGGKLDLNVPGFDFINFQAYVYDTVRDPFNRNLDTTYQFTTAWQKRIVLSSRVKLLFKGFADMIGERGQGVKRQFLTQPQLLLDVGALTGGQENKLFIGTEVRYWKNKFGTNVDEFAPQVAVAFKF